MYLKVTFLLFETFSFALIFSFVSFRYRFESISLKRLKSIPFVLIYAIKFTCIQHDKVSSSSQLISIRSKFLPLFLKFLLILYTLLLASYYFTCVSFKYIGILLLFVIDSIYPLKKKETIVIFLVDFKFTTEIAKKIILFTSKSYKLFLHIYTALYTSNLLYYHFTFVEN